MNKTSIFLGMPEEISKIIQKRMPYLKSKIIDDVACDLGNWIIERAAKTTEMGDTFAQQRKAETLRTCGTCSGGFNDCRGCDDHSEYRYDGTSAVA